ncbi:autotransporter-associated beta strand repeat-containing protein [Stenotrophomonas bentonitica]
MNKVFKVVWSKAVGQWVVTSEFGAGAGSRTRRKANRLTTGPLAALSLMTSLALYGPSAMAAVDITNIGFETGTLSGWTYSKTGTQGSTSYGSTGVGAAVVTGMTDFEADNGTHSWTVTPFGNNMASLQAGAGSDSFTTAATALGLDAASRALVASTMAGSPTNASWLYQDLTLAAGDYFSMAWQYVSTDYEPFNDASLTSLINLGDASVFATVNNQNAQYALLGATNLGTGSYSTGSYGATGWQVATYQVSTAGTYRLGFMSLNLQDTQLSPVLFVDQAPGLTFDKGVPFGPVAPNPGSGAPTTPTTPTTPTGPIIIDGPKGTDELGNEDEASFEGGTLVVDKDTNVDVDFKIDDKPGTIDQNGHESTFTGKIDDATNGVPGSLIVKNSGNGGSVTLTNTNGYTGTTEVDENATLALSGNGSIDKSKKLVIDGTLDVTQAGPVVNITSLDGKGDVALGNNTLSITDANDEFEGTIGGQGDVAIKGGTQVLSGTNTYAGGTSVSNNAVLQVSSDENLGDAAGGLAFNGGTLHTTGDVSSDRDVVLAGDGTFTADANTTLTNSGDVSGNGGLIKNGEGGLDLTGTVSHSGGTTVNEGELTLSGQNTYTGGTTLNGGVLNVSSDGNLGDATGGLTFNGGTLHTTGDVASDRDVLLAGDGTFTTDADTTLTNSGDVSGNGGLIKNGEGGLELTGTVSHSGGTTVNEGELTLSGQNTYTGGTTLNGGVLNISSDGNLGDATGGLTFNGGTLQASSSMTTGRSMVLDSVGALRSAEGSTLTVNGPISGGGTLVADGQGTLVLGAANTHAGGTLISGGTVVLAHAGGLGSGAVAINDATLRTTVDTQVTQPLLVMGEATLDVASGTTTQLTGMLDGSRSTGCFIKSGAGRLNMAGTAVLANGTCVNEGTLSANGVLLSNVQVEREGTVRGTGTIAGNMRVDGTLAPGNSPGTLAVTGTVTLTDDATLQIDIDGYGTGAGAGNYSRLLVSGAAGRFVANGTLQPLLRGISGNAGNTFTPKVGDMFRIVSGEGGVTGTFDRILQPTEGLAASTRFQVYYTTGFDIDLYVTPTAYSADLVGKVNGNGLATAAALDALVEASDAGTTTAEQTDLLRAVWQQDAVALPVLVTALTGESHAKLAALAQSNATALADDVTGRLGQGVLLDASSTRIDQLLWANIGYGDLSVDADASADRFDARQRRATAGIDVYRSSNVAWGAGLGRTTSELERSPLDNTLDSNAFFAYGAARAGAVVLDGMLSYSADRWESQRTDALGADGSLSGKASGTTRMASAGVSLPFTAAGLSWQPSLRGNWQKVERNAYREGGDSLAALDVARLQAEGSRATLGLSVGSLLNDPLAARGTWQFGLQAGINHGQARQATVTTALAGERVDLSAAEAGKAFGRAQLQGTVRLGASTYLYGGVSTEQGSGVENNSVNAGIRIAL